MKDDTELPQPLKINLDDCCNDKSIENISFIKT